jgi:hypothetical protein
MSRGIRKSASKAPVLTETWSDHGGAEGDQMELSDAAPSQTLPDMPAAPAARPLKL